MPNIGPTIPMLRGSVATPPVLEGTAALIPSTEIPFAGTSVSTVLVRLPPSFDVQNFLLEMNPPSINRVVRSAIDPNVWALISTEGGPHVMLMWAIENYAAEKNFDYVLEGGTRYSPDKGTVTSATEPLEGIDWVPAERKYFNIKFVKKDAKPSGDDDLPPTGIVGGGTATALSSTESDSSFIKSSCISAFAVPAMQSAAMNVMAFAESATTAVTSVRGGLGQLSFLRSVPPSAVDSSIVATGTGGVLIAGALALTRNKAVQSGLVTEAQADVGVLGLMIPFLAKDINRPTHLAATFLSAIPGAMLGSVADQKLRDTGWLEPHEVLFSYMGAAATGTIGSFALLPVTTVADAGIVQLAKSLWAASRMLGVFIIPPSSVDASSTTA